MYIVFYITAAIILLYMSYPLFLMALPGIETDKETIADHDPSVTVILLSYNGIHFLENKIQFLLRELSVFDKHELIVIDDSSNDGSGKYLEKMNVQGVRAIIHPDHRGIPFSMNLGVDEAQYDIVIFCDQRQEMSTGIIKKLVQPLSDRNVGAVSACISSLDKENHHSSIRIYENFIKSRESRCGCLIGVYGPCYAIRKEEYISLPEDIILDDLFLSLRMMSSKTVLLQEDCHVYDDNMSRLYTFGRARRYLKGFWQILCDREIRNHLNLKQHIMLLWHKYLRLLIPISIGLSFLNLVILAFYDSVYIVILLALSLTGLLVLSPRFSKSNNGLKCLIKVTVCYLAGMFAVLFQKKKKNEKQMVKNAINLTSQNNPEQII